MDIKSFMPEEEEGLEYLRMLRLLEGMKCVYISVPSVPHTAYRPIDAVLLSKETRCVGGKTADSPVFIESFC